MIHCIIIDDEPLARQLLQSYVAETPGLNCIALCKSAVEAFAVLHDQKVDLMLLDINMPGITGLNFLRSLNNPPMVIFTTAYAEYAVEAFELEAVDYLLKPITPERFLKAVQKVLTTKTGADLKPMPKATSFFVKIDKRLVKVNFADIQYLEALGDYVKIVTPAEVLVTHNTISRIETLLPVTQFIRIHRSYIIALAHLKFLEGNFLKVGMADLPIGATYRDALLEKLNG